MTMRRLMMVILAGLAATASGQVRITSIERLALPADRVWSAPQFSPDGASVYVTTGGYRGIWQYTPATRQLRQICDDAGAGYGFSVSPDGGKIAYRRTLEGTPMNRRVQEIVEVALASGEQVVLAGGRDLPAPSYAGDRVMYTPTSELKNAPAVTRPSTGSYILGIEDTRIAAVVEGSPVQLDPYHGGSYIWPSLSPDGTRLVAYEMSRGAFVADLQGTVLAEFGRRDAPSWMRSGRWIVYMDAKDDGHQILSSDISCISPDGKTTVRLTNTPAIELMPVCSPVDNRILVCTPGGEVYVLGYEEGV
jgi:Tol biopolymer transport system component